MCSLTFGKKEYRNQQPCFILKPYKAYFKLLKTWCLNELISYLHCSDRYKKGFYENKQKYRYYIEGVTELYIILAFSYTDLILHTIQRNNIFCMNKKCDVFIYLSFVSRWKLSIYAHFVVDLSEVSHTSI